jgi:hypothetical protein
MYFAMCADTGMLVGFLIFLLVVGAVGATSFVVAVMAITKWVSARQKRLAAGA